MYTTLLLYSDKWVLTCIRVAVTRIPIYEFTKACLSIFLLTNTWAIYKFRLLWRKWLWIFMCKYFYGHLFSFSWRNLSEWNWWVTGLMYVMFTRHCSFSSQQFMSIPGALNPHSYMLLAEFSMEALLMVLLSFKRGKYDLISDLHISIFFNNSFPHISNT